MTVVVAPREIADYVNRAARVAGCRAGIAGRIAEAVTYGALRDPSTLADFVADRGSHEAMVHAIAAVHLAETQLKMQESPTCTARFEHPVAVSVLQHAVAVAASRGCRVEFDLADGSAAPRRAIGLRVTAGPAVALDDAPEAAALRSGTAVDPQVWQQLQALAAPYLVDESLLDDQVD